MASGFSRTTPGRLYVASGFSRATPGPTEVGRYEEQPLRQCRALDKLEDERLHAIRFFESVNRGDVGMIERREDLRFAFEAREAIGIEGEQLGQDFEGDVAIQLGVARAIHLAHSAAAERREDFIWTESKAAR